MDDSELITKHIGYIKNIVNKFCLPSHQDYDDYLQLGRIAFWEAIKLQNPTKGAVITLAWKRIYWHIIKYLKRQIKHKHKPLTDNLSLVQHIDLKEFFPSNLSSLESDILNLRAVGYNISVISKKLGHNRKTITMHYLKAIRKIKQAND
jgi:DNA-directed RNA polymerase